MPVRNPKVERPKSEVNRTKGKVNFTKDDVQAYYDIKVLGGLTPDDAAKLVGARFGVKITVSPTGDVQLPATVPDKEYSGQALPGPEEPPPEGAPKAPVPPKVEKPKGKDIKDIPPGDDVGAGTPAGKANNAGEPAKEDVELQPVAVVSETLDDAIADLAVEIAKDLIDLAHRIATEKEARFRPRPVEDDLRTKLREIIRADIDAKIQRGKRTGRTTTLDPDIPDERELTPALRAMFSKKQRPKYQGFGWRSLQARIKKMDRFPWAKHDQWDSIAKYAHAIVTASLNESLVEAVKVRKQDRDILIGMLRYGNRFGDEVKELAELIGPPATPRKVQAIAKRYEGVKFKGGVIRYQPRRTFSQAQAQPGIKRTAGLSTPIPATVYVMKRRKKKGKKSEALDPNCRAYTSFLVENPEFANTRFAAFVSARARGRPIDALTAAEVNQWAMAWWAEEIQRRQQESGRHGLLPSSPELYDTIHTEMVDLCGESQEATYLTIAEYKRQGGAFLTTYRWPSQRTPA